MKSSRVGRPSPGCRAGLLAIALLAVPAAACIAQTGTSEGTGTATTADRKSPAASGTVDDTSAPGDPKGIGAPSPPSGPGPVFGPVPSPWDPPANGSSPATSVVNGAGQGQAPVPSPWMSPGTGSANTASSSQPSTPPPASGKTG